jgi:hypothetical protein
LGDPDGAIYKLPGGGELVSLEERNGDRVEEVD